MWHLLICCLVQNAAFWHAQCVPCQTADVGCCVTLQTCSAVSHGGHVRCLTQQMRLLCPKWGVPVF